MDKAVACLFLGGMSVSASVATLSGLGILIGLMSLITFEANREETIDMPTPHKTRRTLALAGGVLGLVGLLLGVLTWMIRQALPWFW